MTTIVTIPVRSDLEAYSFSCALDGVNYVLSFAFNYRSSLWSVDIAAADGTPILSGIPVQTGVDLIGRFVPESRPPGRLLAIDTTGNGTDPGRDDLGNNVLLLYAGVA